MAYYTGPVSRSYSPAMLAGTPLRPGSAPSAPSAQSRTFNYSDDELNPEPEPEHHSRFSLHRNRNRSRSRSRSRTEEPIFLGEEGDPSPPPPGPMDHRARKAHKHKIKTLRAEIKIARGMEVLWKEKKKGRLGAGGGAGGESMMAGVMGMAEQFEEQVRVEKNVSGGGGGGVRRGRQRSASFGALEPQGGSTAGGGMAMAMGLLGMAEQYEHTRPQRSRAQSVSSAPAASPTAGSAPASEPSEGFLQQLERQAASPAGFAAIASVVGVAAHELHDLRQRSRSQSLAGEMSPAVNASVAPVAPRAVPDSSRSSRASSRNRSRNGTSTPSTSIPRPMSRQPQSESTLPAARSPKLITRHTTQRNASCRSLTIINIMQCGTLLLLCS